jgi:hypothetical protein
MERWEKPWNAGKAMERWESHGTLGKPWNARELERAKGQN